MPDYYIRTNDHEESRGPFDPPKLQTLAEADQITENTLYYDETKEEWVPIALNKELKNQVFPRRDKLILQVGKATQKTEAKNGESATEEEEEEEESGLNVEEMLAAAAGETEETSYLKKDQKSFEKAAALATSSIGLMMLLSAVVLLIPHLTVVNAAFQQERYSSILNYPFIILGLFDFLMAVFLFLAVTEVYPLLRGRGMLTLGFGVYLGWSLGDPILMVCSVAAGFGIFYATIARSLPTMLLAMVLGIGGNGTLAYLAISGRLSGFFEAVHFEFITSG
jgi:hypothetical protein